MLITLAPIVIKYLLNAYDNKEPKLKSNLKFVTYLETFYFLMLLFFFYFTLDSLLKTPHSKTKKKRRSIVAVAQSHLTFIKPLKAGKYSLYL